jgi:hypothetical protein
VTAARGLRQGLGLELQLPFRAVRDRVHYLDLNRAPYVPPNPDFHHRNETLTGVGDPQVAAHLGRQGRVWAFGARVGISIPLGRTEPNPFALGRLGLPHQHIQFGTGTWDPILATAVGRPIGAFETQLAGTARLTFAENDHGYRAGNRYTLRFGASRPLGRLWGASAGLLYAREETERWNGTIETEGNLGRRDLFLSLGGGLSVSSQSSLALSLDVPISSHSTGEQVEVPLIFSLTWTRSGTAAR